MRSPETWLKFAFSLDRAGELTVATDARGSPVRPYNYDGARALRALLAGVRRLWAARGHPKAATVPPPSKPVVEAQRSPRIRESSVTRKQLDDARADLNDASVQLAAIEDDLRGLQVMPLCSKTYATTT